MGENKKNEISAINRVGLRDKLRTYTRTPGSFAVLVLIILSAIITTAVIVFLIGYILVNGVGYINKDLFAFTYTSENCSVIPALINTIIIAAVTLLMALPFGIFAAIYLVEYAKKGNKIVKLIRVTSETLTGIPSIVYGLFGMLFFVTALGWSNSMLAGAVTLAIMILPVILRTTEEALLAVPASYREGSYGLGAGKLRTIFLIVLPSAVPGILSGVILAIGRIVGESAALLYTAGTIAKVPKNLLESGRTLSVHMYVLSSEGLHIGQAYATAVIVLIVVVIMNALSSLIAKHISNGRNR